MFENPATSAGWRAHPVAPDLRIVVTRTMPDLRPTVDHEVARLWDAAQARAGGALFNGRVFSADRLAPARIEGHWTEYRRVIARIARPDLAAELHAAPVAAGGVIVGGAGDAGFVLIGRRPANAVYQAGEWQLPPAGSLDPGALDPGAADGDTVDPVRQLLVEMAEELGLPAAAVADPRPLCLVEHPGSGVLDLGIAVRTAWTPAEILAAHAQGGNGEYDPLLAVRIAELPDFLSRHQGCIARQTYYFLACAGLPAGGVSG